MLSASSNQPQYLFYLSLLSLSLNLLIPIQLLMVLFDRYAAILQISKRDQPIMDKTHIYTVKFGFKQLQATCQRAGCRVHIYVKIQNQQRKLTTISELRKNVATINGDLVWPDISIPYNSLTNTYYDLIASVAIHYETSSDSRTNLKVGQVSLNLSKLLNTKTYRIVTQYPVEKCYDSQAKLKVSVEFEKQEDPPEQLRPLSPTQQPVSSSWRVSKIRERMGEDEKQLLQNKLNEYEQRMDRYRDEHADQLRRLHDQIDRKDEKIQTLSSELQVTLQGLQAAQTASEKHKGRADGLEKQVAGLAEDNRSILSNKEQLSRQLSIKNQQLEDLHAKLSNLEQTKQKKQIHYKQELDKYMAKFIESENMRNKVVLEMENKLTQQLSRKDELHRETLAKLDAKCNQLVGAGRETMAKKDRELADLGEKVRAVEGKYAIACQELEIAKQKLAQEQQQIQAYRTQISSHKSGNKSLQCQLQMLSYNKKSLTEQLHKQKSNQKHLQRQVEELSLELQLANQTIQKQSEMTIKLHRNIKMHKEREYYIEEKYQDQVDATQYQEECLAGNREYWRTLAHKFEAKAKFLEDKTQELEASLQSAETDRKQLLENGQVERRLTLQNAHQLLRLESQCKKAEEKCQELEFEVAQKDIYAREVQQKLGYVRIQHQNEINSYLSLVSELEKKCRDAELRVQDLHHEWELRFEDESKQKADLLAVLEIEVDKLKDSERTMRNSIIEHEKRQSQWQSETETLRAKVRMQQRQINKQKQELSSTGGQKVQQSETIRNLQASLSQAKTQMHNRNSQHQKLLRRHQKFKEMLTQLLKWVFDRNWEDAAKGELFFGFSTDIGVQYLEHISQGMQRIYTAIFKLRTQVEELKIQNQRITQKSESNRYEEMHIWAKQQQGYPREQSKQNQNYFSSLKEIPSPQETQLEAHHTHQLQQELASRNWQVQQLQQEILEMGDRIRKLTNELQNMQQENEQLTEALAKKNGQLVAVEAQMQMGRNGDVNGLDGGRNRIVDDRGIRNDAEWKFRESKTIAELEAKIHELETQNQLLISKIQLLETKTKTSTEKNNADTQKISQLQNLVRQKDEKIRLLNKDKQQKESQLETIERQLENSGIKLAKKQSLIEQLRQLLEQQKQICEIWEKQVKQWQSKSTIKQKQHQQQLKHLSKQVQMQTQPMSQQLVSNQQTIMSLSLQLSACQNEMAQLQQRCCTMENALGKNKQEGELLHEKYLLVLGERNQLEEQLKDCKTVDGFVKQGLQKQIQQINQDLLNKEFQVQEIRFKYESRILELQKMLEDRLVIEEI